MPLHGVLRDSSGTVTSGGCRRPEPDDTSCMHGDKLFIEPAANNGVGAGHPATGADSCRVVDHFKSLERPATIVRNSQDRKSVV